MSDLLGAEWDLGEVLAERAQPKDSVAIYLNEVASHAKAQLMKAQAASKKDAVAQVDQDLAAVESELEKSKYVIHLTAIPSRMREDITSKAMAAHPIKPNMLGQDDVENARTRRQYENDLIWHAQITNVVNPSGQSKTTWAFDEIQKFAAVLPTAVQNAVDVAIRTLTTEAEQFTAASKSQDF